MPPASRPPIGTIAVVGAGAMGAMYADHFSRAGIRTLLVARGERAARLRTQPIRVNGHTLDAEVVDPLDARWEASGPVGLVIVAVKHRQLPDAVELVRPLVSSDTTVLSVLNGLDSEEAILRGLRQPGPTGTGPAVDVADEQVPLCIALAMDAEREANDVRCTQAGRLVFGHRHLMAGDEAGPDGRLESVRDALTRAGLEWSAPDDMLHELWWKFMVNVGINQPSAVLRAPYGAFAQPGPARELMTALIEEVRTVAAAEGVELTDADVSRWDSVLAGQPTVGMTSMHQDVLAGRPTEIDVFAGRVVSLGRQHGIPVPYNQTMLWIVQALDRAAGASSS